MPSYVIEHGNMFDLEVTEVLVEYEKEIVTGQKPAPNLSKDEMMNMIKSVREKENVKKVTKKT